jgi:hypothetical protein
VLIKIIYMLIGPMSLEFSLAYKLVLLGDEHASLDIIVSCLTSEDAMDNNHVHAELKTRATSSGPEDEEATSRNSISASSAGKESLRTEVQDLGWGSWV